MEFLGKNAKVVPDDVGLSVHVIMDRASVSYINQKHNNLLIKLIT